MASSSSSSSVPVLAFGVEIELLVRPRSSFVTQLRTAGWDRAVSPQSGSGAARNRDVLRRAIARELSNAQISAITHTDNYSSWTVADEPSLDEEEGLWRLELISRIIGTNEKWQTELSNVFLVLNQHCEVKLSPGCSMHVHVSPSKDPDSPRKYTMPELHRIMKAMAYYDDAITKVMPPTRKNNPWAGSNMTSEKSTKSVRDAYAAVRSNSWGPLFAILEKVRFKQQVTTELFNDKYFTWNFKHITTACGTIEFRRPPGVQTAAQAAFWTGFTLAFIRQAMVTNWTDYQASRSHPPVKDLRDFIGQGLSKLEGTCQGAVDVRRVEENTSLPTRFSSAEIQAINRKKAMKDRQEGGFAQKANSRPNTPTSSKSRSSSNSSNSRR